MHARTASFLFGMAAVLADSVGCTSGGASWKKIDVDKIDTPGVVSLMDAFASANEVAEAELNRVNAESWPNNPGSPSIPFALCDYDKEVSQFAGDDGHRWFCFTYKYRRARGFFGHPAHFDVCVDRSTGQTKLSRGR